MTNQIFLKHQKKIKHFFKKYQQDFLRTMFLNPSLQAYKKILFYPITKSILQLTNLLIYHCDCDIKHNANFSSQYTHILKAVTLVVAAMIDNNQNNIFNHEYVIEINHNKPHLYCDEVNASYLNKLDVSKNQIYSYCINLYNLMNCEVKFDDFYNLIVNILLLFLIKDSMYNYVNFFNIKIKTHKRAFTTDKTLTYLAIFKHVRMQLQNHFPLIFNDLIFIINSQ